MEIELDDWEPPILCQDCGEAVLKAHSQMGFGHYKRCCKCYERRQRGPKPVDPASKTR